MCIRDRNSWVYAGFNETYKRLGVDFDQVQYESNTYLLGKDIIEDGLAKGVFFKKDDNSVWIDLTEDGLDQKLVLRGDGTSVYMTQDLGTAVERFKQNDIQKLIYTVGNEQDYHFQVLFLILKKLGYDWANQLYHLSYGMVELPEGKMKSREGTVAVSYTHLDVYKRQVPYSQALQVDKYLSPKYDDGLTIYKDLIVRIDKDLAALDSSSEGFGADDVLYHGCLLYTSRCV